MDDALPRALITDPPVPLLPSPLSARVTFRASTYWPGLSPARPSRGTRSVSHGEIKANDGGTVIFCVARFRRLSRVVAQCCPADV
jgi:hypothetical protein